MGVVADWNVLFRADNTQFKKVLKENRDEIGKTDNSFKGLLKSLKNDFGKSSVLGQSLKLMAGGGAVGALSGAGNKLKEFTGELIELKKAFQDGEIGTGQLVDR